MMKHCLILCVAVASVSVCSGQVAPSAKPSAVAVLADGTPVKLKVPATINIAALQVGDAVELSVAAPVIVNGETVISTDGVADAVVSSQRGGIVKSEANKVDITLRSVTLTDGERVPLRAHHQAQGGLPAVTVTSNGAGQDVSIGNGSELTAYVVGNLTLDLAKLRLADQPTAEVRVSSTPSGAEISVDGRIVGLAPYTAHVPRGEHVFVVRVAGYQPWSKTVLVADQPADLQVQLQRQDNTEAIPQAKTAAPSLGELARQARAKKAAQEQQKVSDPSPSPAPASSSPAQN